MYITVDDIKNEISFDKKVGVIRAYFVCSFKMLKTMKRSTLRMMKR